jgi:hypothetical protein
LIEQLGAKRIFAAGFQRGHLLPVKSSEFYCALLLFTPRMALFTGNQPRQEYLDHGQLVTLNREPGPACPQFTCDRRVPQGVNRGGARLHTGEFEIAARYISKGL